MPILEVLHSLAAVGVILLAAFGLGRPVVRALRLVEHDPLAVATWSLATGLLLAGTTLYGFGLAGWLHPAVAAGLSLAGCTWGAAELACVYLGWTAARVLDLAAPPEQADSHIGRDAATAVMLLAALGVLTLTLVAALAPTTSPQALSRSLEVPKTILLSQSVHGQWASLEPAPTLVQMWYLWALALDGPVAAGLLHWCVGLLLAMAAVLLAQPILGTSRGLLAGAFVLLCPGIQYQMSAPLDDLGPALFATLALAGAFRILSHFESSRWPEATGVMLGGAVAAGAGAWPLVPALGAAWFYVAWRTPQARGTIAMAGAKLLAATSLVAGAWLASGWQTGMFGPAQGLAEIIRHLGPVVGIGVVGLVLVRRLRGLRLIAGVAAVYAGVAALVPAGKHGWAALAPMLAIVAAWAWYESERLAHGARLCARGAWIAAALFAALPSLAPAADALAVALGWQSRHEYLLARVPTYRAAAVVSRIGPPQQRVLCQDVRTFYFTCLTASRDSTLSQQQAQAAALSERECLAAARASGCSYLVLAEDDARDGQDAHSLPATPADAPSPPGGPQADAAIDQVIPILEYRFADDNNRYIRYRVLKLR